jgi:hypothetical protein
LTPAGLARGKDSVECPQRSLRQIEHNRSLNMKKLTLALSLALLAGFGATTATAQRYDARVDIPRIANPDREVDVRDERGRGDWGRRSRYELERLNAEVVQVRREIGNLRDGRIRERFSRVRRATDRLNYAFENRMIRGWEVNRRADEIRSELNVIRRELRARYGLGGRIFR